MYVDYNYLKNSKIVNSKTNPFVLNYFIDTIDQVFPTNLLIFKIVVLQIF